MPALVMAAQPAATLKRQDEALRRLVCVFLPFAAGFYLSYLFRGINALIANYLTYDLGFSVAELGLVTAAYFLAFALAQIPIGIALDRYGPRRVQSVLLVVAAFGAALFALSNSFAAFLVARALIGLGVAGSLAAGLKAIILWYPRERVALVNGYMVMLGALGAVTATAPIEPLLAAIGWRGLFEVLAFVTVGIAAGIFFVVPEKAGSSPRTSGLAGLETVYSDRRFWRLAPLAATTVGSAWALQGLWAAPWLVDVAGVERADLGWYLLVLASALCVGAAMLGNIADRLARRGIAAQDLLAVVALVHLGAQLALALDWPVSYLLSWGLISAVGAATVLSYAIAAQYFARELAGRANAAINVFHLGGAFLLQYAVGLILQQFPVQDGRHPPEAYQIAFGVCAVLQAGALAWFMVPVARRASRLERSRHPPVSRQPYRYAADVWHRHLHDALEQARVWRLASFGAMAISISLGLWLARSTGQATVLSYVMDAARLPRADAAEPRLTASHDSR